jgi:hypothetical protein
VYQHAGRRVRINIDILRNPDRIPQDILAEDIAHVTFFYDNDEPQATAEIPPWVECQTGYLGVSISGARSGNSPDFSGYPYG